MSVTEPNDAVNTGMAKQTEECLRPQLLGWIPSYVLPKSRLIQLSKTPDGNPDHGLSVHKDASIQNINLTVFTTAGHKKTLKTGNPWFLKGR